MHRGLHGCTLCVCGFCCCAHRHRYIIQSLPLILVLSIALVMAATRLLQFVQSRVFHVLPVGALSSSNLSDICVGILVSGLFMLYFGVFVSYMHRRGCVCGTSHMLVLAASVRHPMLVLARAPRCALVCFSGSVCGRGGLGQIQNCVASHSMVATGCPLTA